MFLFVSWQDVHVWIQPAPAKYVDWSIKDKTAREAAYSKVLTALHDEAIFLPITAKRQTAVTNTRVSGFRFG